MLQSTDTCLEILQATHKARLFGIGIRIAISRTPIKLVKPIREDVGDKNLLHSVFCLSPRTFSNLVCGLTRRPHLALMFNLHPLKRVVADSSIRSWDVGFGNGGPVRTVSCFELI